MTQCEMCETHPVDSVVHVEIPGTFSGTVKVCVFCDPEERDRPVETEGGEA